MIDVLRIAHLRIAPQEGNLEVGNCEGNQNFIFLYDHVLGELLSQLSGDPGEPKDTNRMRI